MVNKQIPVTKQPIRNNTLHRIVAAIISTTIDIKHIISRQYIIIPLISLVIIINF